MDALSELALVWTWGMPSLKISLMPSLKISLLSSSFLSLHGVEQIEIWIETGVWGSTEKAEILKLCSSPWHKSSLLVTGLKTGYCV